MKKADYAELSWSGKAQVVMADLRVVPRVMVVLYFMAGWLVMNWFMALDKPSMEQGAFVVTFAGILPAVLNLYAKTGKKEE